jgi:hypothetical protein
MMSHDLKSVLLRNGLVSPELMNRAIAETSGTTTTWLEQLIKQRAVSEEAVAACAGRAAFVPLCDLDRLELVPNEIIAEVPWDLAIEHRLVPLAVEADNDLRVAMVDPLDEVANTELEFFLGRRLLREVAPARALAWALNKYYHAETALWPARGAVSNPAIVRPSTQRIPAAQPRHSKQLQAVLVG